jgi:hypothetical protein
MRILALVTLILGLAAIVLGVVFMLNAGSGNDEIAESVAPLTLDQVEPTYDQIVAQVKLVPQTDPSYLMIAGQRTSLGLAKANIANMKILRLNGLVDIIVGLGLLIAGLALFTKKAS